MTSADGPEPMVVASERAGYIAFSVLGFDSSTTIHVPSAGTRSTGVLVTAGCSGGTVLGCGDVWLGLRDLAGVQGRPCGLSRVLRLSPRRPVGFRQQRAVRTRDTYGDHGASLRGRTDVVMARWRVQIQGRLSVRTLVSTPGGARSW